MPIVSADIDFYLSGGAGNADPNASLGGVISTTEWTGGTLHDLFDKITGDENAAGDDEYRGIYVKNNHGTLALEGTKLWLSGPRFTAEADDDIFTSTAHGFLADQAVRLEAEYATDTLPGGFNNATTYFVRDVTANTFKLAATAGGVAINVTSDGTGAARKYGTTTVSLALAGEGVNATMETIANEDTPPAGEVFTSPTTKAGGLTLGDIAAGQRYGIWIKRLALNTVAVDNDGATLKVEGDTAA